MDLILYPRASRPSKSKPAPLVVQVVAGYILSNNIGIIDCSYKGNLYICLTKVSHDAIDITFPFKCCQLILKKQYFPQFKITNELYKTKRNDGGFGSTT